MKKKYSQIKKEERDEISILLNKGFGVRDIAYALGRDPGVISKELPRNRKKNGVYDPKAAHHKAYVRRKYAKYQGKKINENNGLTEYLLEGLKRYWSPDRISGRMRYEGKPFYVSKTAIYEWLYSQWGQFGCQYLYSQRYRPKSRGKKKMKKTLIPNRKGLGIKTEGGKREIGSWPL